MILRNCKACGAKLTVVKTIPEPMHIKRIKLCATCNETITSYEIHSGYYQALQEAHRAQGNPSPLDDDTSKLMRGLLPQS